MPRPLHPLIITPENKNLISLTLQFKFDDLRISDMKDLTFTDVLLPDGTAVKDVTFSQLQPLVLNLENKNPIILLDEIKT